MSVAAPVRVVVGFRTPQLERRTAEGGVDGRTRTPESFVRMAERMGLGIDRAGQTWDSILRDTIEIDGRHPMSLTIETAVSVGRRAE